MVVHHDLGQAGHQPVRLRHPTIGVISVCQLVHHGYIEVGACQMVLLVLMWQGIMPGTYQVITVLIGLALVVLCWHHPYDISACCNLQATWAKVFP